MHDNTTEAAFTAWKVGEFIQTLTKLSEYKFPKKWERTDLDTTTYRSGGYLKALPEDDKKYVRVYFEVLQRYPREPLRYQEEQLSILRNINTTLTHVSVGPRPRTQPEGQSQTLDASET